MDLISKMYMYIYIYIYTQYTYIFVHKGILYRSMYCLNELGHEWGLGSCDMKPGNRDGAQWGVWPIFETFRFFYCNFEAALFFLDGHCDVDNYHTFWAPSNMFSEGIYNRHIARTMTSLFPSAHYIPYHQIVSPWIFLKTYSSLDIYVYIYIFTYIHIYIYIRTIKNQPQQTEKIPWNKKNQPNPSHEPHLHQHQLRPWLVTSPPFNPLRFQQFGSTPELPGWEKTGGLVPLPRFRNPSDPQGAKQRFAEAGEKGANLG